MITRTFKVFGRDGHHQRMSFQPSGTHTTWSGRIVEILNSDVTGTNDYSIVRISSTTSEDCLNGIYSQVDDGYFEGARVGRVVEVMDDGSETVILSH